MGETQSYKNPEYRKSHKNQKIKIKMKRRNEKWQRITHLRKR